MSEPFYIRQTADPEHLANPLDWFLACAKEAAEAGGKWPRYSVDRIGEPPTIILFECWKKRPNDPGEQRWIVET